MVEDLGVARLPEQHEGRVGDPPPHTYENTVRDPQAQSRVISRDLGLF